MTDPVRTTSRMLLPVLILMLVIGCRPSAPAAPGGPKPLPTAKDVSVSGSLVYGAGNTLVTMEIATKQKRTLATFPPNSYLSSPNVSPDQRTIALSVYTPPAATNASSGADLYLVDASGGTPRLLLGHGGTGVSLEEPAWASDGHSLYFTVWTTRLSGTQFLGQDVTIDQMGLDGSGRRTVVTDGRSPTISADGNLLAYLSPAATAAASVWAASPTGQEARRVSTAGFDMTGSPRFGPQGHQLIFAAVGGGAAQERPRSPSLGGLLAPQAVFAHGIPWEIWSLDVDSRNLRRLTDLQEDNPSPTWSRDGAWIAFTGELGIYLVDSEGKRTVKLTDDLASGIAWLQP